jgi:hypothetical protein
MVPNHPPVIIFEAESFKRLDVRDDLLRVTFRGSPILFRWNTGTRIWTMAFLIGIRAE